MSIVLALVLAEGWLGALQDRVAADAKAGLPIVIEAHVPLCSNEILRCGGGRLGDGDDPGGNLYWSTSGGFVGWFNRRGSGWTEVERRRGQGDVLEVRVWKRRVVPGQALARRGVHEPFEVIVVARAWRGTAIDRAVEAWVTDLYGASSKAHVVAYVGHNRWMDVPRYDWEAAARRRAGPVKGAIALACKTADYLAEDVPAPGRVPLLMTRDFLFAGAHGFEGAVRAFVEGGSLAAIREGAAAAYAAGQGKPTRRVRYAFTNPSDARWPEKP